MCKDNKKPCGSICTDEECEICNEDYCGGLCGATIAITNYARIKSMTIDEMALFIEGLVAVALGTDKFINPGKRKQWLESEID